MVLPQSVYDDGSMDELNKRVYDSMQEVCFFSPHLRRGFFTARHFYPTNATLVCDLSDIKFVF